MTLTRDWGRSGIRTSALGFGGWAIGGPWSAADGSPLGWGAVDDDESIKAVQTAFDLGVTFFDTADVYGTGRSERVLGTALKAHRSEVVIASKWGNTFDAEARVKLDTDVRPEYVRTALLASLSRLGTDYLDLYQFHLSDAPLSVGAALRDACEDLVTEGLIRGYGWSTDDPARAAVFAEGPHCAAIQHECSVLHDAPELLELCAKEELASINRTPLAMGLLTGKSAVSNADDIRSTPPGWLRFFAAGGAAAPEWAARRDAIREVLTAGGRTLAQGALGWLWARSPRTIPIPGCRTVAQATENAAALRFGPLAPDQLTAISGLLSPA